jgi:hypothetical protein
MSAYDSTDIDYFAEAGEEELCREFNLVVDRYVLPITENEYLYEVPSYCYNIRRFTYRGRQLNPYSGSEQIWSGSTPQRYSQGEPREYIYNFLGRKTIRFFPTPAESLSGSGDGWSGSVIRDQCVLEFFRTPDFTNEFLRIPAWFREQVCENYAILHAAKMDNQGFDSKTLKHYTWKWNKDRENVSSIKQMLFRAVPKVMASYGENTYNRYKPARPSLPWNFPERVR